MSEDRPINDDPAPTRLRVTSDPMMPKRPQKVRKMAHNDVEATLAPRRVFRRCTVKKTPDLRDFETIGTTEG